MFEKYVDFWNKESIFIIQVESREGVENINSLLSFDEIDGVNAITLVQKSSISEQLHAQTHQLVTLKNENIFSVLLVSWPAVRNS